MADDVQAAVTRRDVVKAGAAVVAAAPFLQTIKAANDQVQYGLIGSGSRGTYLLKHLKNIETGRCVALCDIQPKNLDHGVETIGNNPAKYTDHREMLNRKDLDAVFVITPLFTHYAITKDVIESGRHVFCEKTLVFKPEEVHGLRTLMAEHPNKILQTGLQRRYSGFYQTVKQMVDKGVLGNVHHIHAQWHRNMINRPSALWTMKPGGESNINNWRLYRTMSGGLTAELCSHQVDVSDWILWSSPEFVMGLGSIDTLKDGRTVYDNIQLIYKYPGGQKLTYSSISTSQFLPYFNASRPEMGEIIMGTEGTVEITVGDDTNHAVAWWYREPPKVETVSTPKKEDHYVAGATMVASGRGAIGPIPLMMDDTSPTRADSFLTREAKFARRWLYQKGIWVQEEQANPVDTELRSFFQNCKDGQKPKADLEVGMGDAIAVMLSNQAMDEGRKVYFNEIEKAPKMETVAKR